METQYLLFSEDSQFIPAHDAAAIRLRSLTPSAPTGLRAALASRGDRLAAHPRRALLGAPGRPPTRLRLIGPKRSHRKARQRLLGSIAFTLTEALHVRAIDQVFGTQVQHATRQGSERVVGGFEVVGQLAVVAPAVLVDGTRMKPSFSATFLPSRPKKNG